MHHEKAERFVCRFRTGDEHVQANREQLLLAVAGRAFLRIVHRPQVDVHQVARLIFRLEIALVILQLFPKEAVQHFVDLLELGVAGEGGRDEPEEGKVAEERPDHVDFREECVEHALQVDHFLVLLVVPDAGHHRPQRVEHIDAEHVAHLDHRAAVLLRQQVAKVHQQVLCLVLDHLDHSAARESELLQVAHDEAALLLPERFVRQQNAPPQSPRSRFEERSRRPAVEVLVAHHLEDRVRRNGHDELVLADFETDRTVGGELLGQRHRPLAQHARPEALSLDRQRAANHGIPLRPRREIGRLDAIHVEENQHHDHEGYYQHPHLDGRC